MLKRTIDFSSISAIQQTILYVGRLLVQSGVNALGVDAVAAFNAVSIIDSYVLVPVTAWLHLSPPIQPRISVQRSMNGFRRDSVKFLLSQKFISF